MNYEEGELLLSTNSTKVAPSYDLHSVPLTSQQFARIMLIASPWTLPPLHTTDMLCFIILFHETRW